ncbi:hypothetical protein [Modicisalibacter sp. MOD 31.J]|uniref:DUF3846 domain-containing protein n=1 Tax=Modicisalibacter sp. MOD 31.J TaxID=2831897 RepID=UPI001CCD4F1B|nr:hypothetical protein [Modicisalibacter sp. MOD 31.J]MBZ9574574.1 hypothetical protein [Modicisalibacter sp. MOD 31.J]
MRALLIDQGEVCAIELPGTDGPEMLEAMYRAIGCNGIAVVGYPDPGHVAWGDEVGVHARPTQVHAVRWYAEPLVGRIVVTGFDAEGSTQAATMDVAALRSMVRHIG